MARAFNKELFRSITHSWGRFFAIAGIVALGAGFFAGLQMCGLDMRLSLDTYYDQTSFMDLRVVSSMGMSEDDIAALSEVEGVEAVEPARETDLLATIDEGQYVVRMQTVEAASLESCTEGPSGGELSSAAVNQVELVEGSWPQASDECVISKDRVMKSDVQVGDTLTVDECSSGIEDTLTSETYTITGFVHSSYFACSTSLGSSTLGSGEVTQYAFVLRDAFAEDYPITEAFIRVTGAQDPRYLEDEEYDELVSAVEDRINELAPIREQLRLEELKQDAQSELDDAREEYEDKKADADKKLADAKDDLEEAAQTIADSREQIATGWAEYEEGSAELERQQIQVYAQLASAEAQLSAAEAQLAANKQTLDASAAELAAGWQEYKQGKKQYDAGLAEWKQNAQAFKEGEAALQEGLAALDAGIGEATAQRGALQAQLDALDSEDPENAEAIAQLQAAIAGIDATVAGLEQQRAEAQAQLDALEAQRGALDAGKQELDESASTLDAAYRKLCAGQAAYDQGKAAYDEGAAQLATAWGDLASTRTLADQAIGEGAAQLAAAAEQLAQGESELAEGEAEYKDGVAEYKKARAKADKKFAKAERKLADAQKEIDDIDEPEWLVLDRSKNYGAASYKSDAGRIDNIAAVFPLFFFLVAALVALTTMTRMVEEERLLIGTYKALGYGTVRIISKYLIYAALAGLLGCAIGIALLAKFLPYVVISAYNIMYYQPLCIMPYDPLFTVLAVVASVGVTLAATAYAAWSSLREAPAALMMARAPKLGKRILLERITPLWSRMSFLWKVTARNIFRYKKRFFMTVVGIAGCSALLLTGLGLRDGINDIIDVQYGELLHYQLVVSTEDDQSPEDAEAVAAVLDSQEVGEYVHVRQESMLVSSTDSTELQGAQTNGEEKQAVVLTVDDPSTFAELMTLRSRIGHDPVSFDSHSVVVAEKLATVLGLEVGDVLVVAEQDSLGNAKREVHALRVTGITENYIDYYIYVGSDAYEESFGCEPQMQAIFAQVEGDGAVRESLTESLRGVDSVKTVSFNDETIERYRTMLATIDSIIVILIVSAAALAFIVLYNLTNINISERIRELATLKVLGFTPREMRNYIYREVALLAAAGAFFGSFFGKAMETFVIITAEVDGMMFGRTIHPPSYVAAFVLIMFFAVMVMLFMRRKLSNVNMVESLKSNE